MQFIFRQNDQPNYFFYINKGSVLILIDGREVRELKDGSSFGELAILYNSPRSASVQCLQDSEFLVINRVKFQEAIKKLNMVNYENCKEFVESNRFFENLTGLQKELVTENIIIHDYKQGDYIVYKGDQASCYYIIKRGRVQVEDGGRVLRELQEKDGFGEQSLKKQSRRGADVKALTDCTLLVISGQTLKNIFGADIFQIIYQNWMRWIFKSSSKFSQINEILIEKLIKKAEFKQLESKEVILEKGCKVKGLYLVIEGEVVQGGAKLQKCILAEHIFEDLREDSVAEEGVACERDCLVAFVTLEDYLKLVDQNIGREIEKNQLEEQVLRQIMVDYSQKLALKISDFIYVSNLGEGQFGKVILTQNL